MTQAKSKPHQAALTIRALEHVVGQAIVLDRDLKIVAGTTGIERLLGGPLPLGKSAPQVLCGQGDRRPIAEALARGESASAEILRPDGEGEQIISVRSLPLLESGEVKGHLLLIAHQGKAFGGITEIEGILTASESMRSLLRKVERVARSDASVLVRGETGAGKELIAKALHNMSPRRDKPFAAINCAALPPQLLESELFGHTRGAFTGAIKESEGHFRRAEGGTVFLDEIAELPLPVQAKLLRVTQERTVLPVGGSKPIRVNVRLISATHRSLRAEVAAGRFRSDLMYRLRVIPLFLPPLRERPEDISPLIHRFIDTHNQASEERQIERVSPGALRALQGHSWPGNVRELENVIQYAFLLGEGPVLAEGDLPREVIDGHEPTGEPPEPSTYEPSSPAAKRIVLALERAGGNRERAAKSLGISRSTLWRKMKKHGLESLESDL